jgi:nitrite reductase (NADH) small subunit
MTDWLAGPVAELPEDGRKIFVADGHEIVLLRVQGRFRAYENECLHMGGPIGQGVIGGTDSGQYLACPVHGWRYNLATGVCLGNQRLQLRSFPVVVREGNVYVVV